MDKLISISEAGRMLGITPKTLQIWCNEEKIKCYRTVGGHRRFKIEDIEMFLGKRNSKDKKKDVFIYCRVSTKKQQESGNLERQKERLIEYCNNNQYNVIQIFEEVASGLNERRRELIKMFRRLDEVEFILVEYPDRLARLGYTYLEEHAKAFNVTIESIEQNEKLESNVEMVNDLISIVTCFSTRLYDARSGKKIRKDIKDSIFQIEKERGEKSKDNNEGSID